MRINVNGEPREARENLTLRDLVAELNLKVEQIAIELNRLVVRRAQWDSTNLKEHDNIEIVHFVGGGGTF